MFCTITYSVIALIFLYILIKFIKKKLTKPNYSGKTVWITGAASGIGEQLAYQFNRLGAHVIISDLKMEGLKRVQESASAPERIQPAIMDMSNFPQIESVTAQVMSGLQKSGKILDVVVENAGISQRCEFVDFSFQNHLNLLNVNFNGPVRHLQLIVPHMIKNKQGHVVGVSSTAAKLGFPLRSSYAASKHAIIGVLDVIRAEVAAHNILVTNLMPGYVKTNVSKNAMMAAPGQTFGKTDNNIDEGMEPAEFARQAVLEIFTGNPEVSVADNWLLIRILTSLRALCPPLVFIFLAKEAAKQLKAVANAKKD